MKVLNQEERDIVVRRGRSRSASPDNSEPAAAALVAKVPADPAAEGSGGGGVGGGSGESGRYGNEKSASAAARAARRRRVVDQRSSKSSRVAPIDRVDSYSSRESSQASGDRGAGAGAGGVTRRSTGIKSGRSSGRRSHRQEGGEGRRRKKDRQAAEGGGGKRMPAQAQVQAQPESRNGSGNNGKGYRDSGLSVDTTASSSAPSSATPRTDPPTPVSSASWSQSQSYSGEEDRSTPAGHRGRADARSPGAKKSPINAGDVNATAAAAAQSNAGESAPVPDFMTQTDRYGNAVTPRNADSVMNGAGSDAKSGARNGDASGDDNILDDDGNVVGGAAGGRGRPGAGSKNGEDDACETLLESFRSLCCCLLPDDQQNNQKQGGGGNDGSDGGNAGAGGTPNKKGDRYSSSTAAISKDSPSGNTAATDATGNKDVHDPAPDLVEESESDDPDRVRLLPAHHPDDVGKKCLVLDLDETLVHSSFRAVPGADFVIPVQIEDVVHFVYVMKRPGVDEFLIEMAKHYEVVIYTASLNKYADPLLDLLDPHRTIRSRLFRESCVYYEGNYVKDLSLIDRDLRQSIIVDNSSSSFMFHPENAIDCSSFIDDPNDRELDQIGRFLAGVRDVDDVRGLSNLWRDWPNLPQVPHLVDPKLIEDEYERENSRR